MTNVIQIGEFTIQRRVKNHAEKQCEHLNVDLDDNGGIVKCRECGEHLNPYWVLRVIANELSAAWEEIDAEKAKLG